MKRAGEAPLLEYALLGLIHQAPKSGYDLRRVFAATPMGVFSDSPGSVYPALARLERRGWVRPTPEKAGPRRRRRLAITGAGSGALRRWMLLPIEREDVVRRLDELMLRFAFMGEVLDLAATLLYLESFKDFLSEYVRELRSFSRAAKSAGLSTGSLALENGIAQYETHARWARRALQRLRRTDAT